MSEATSEAVNDHIFQTVGLAKDKLDAVCRRSCRAGYRIFLDAADPTVIPPVRIYRVEFESVEDRDRVRIAMRYVEKELAELHKEIAARMVAPQKPIGKVAPQPVPVAAKTPAKSASRLAPA
ncbi:MAG: hypothetical protein K1X51_10135 [Rhodospirillaceae bacterium]|nr:hypothetical protein [Rhodospirillaceae bacterium]